MPRMNQFLAWQVYVLVMVLRCVVVRQGNLKLKILMSIRFENEYIEKYPNYSCRRPPMEQKNPGFDDNKKKMERVNQN